MVDYSAVIIPLSVAAALALAVERLLEVARHLSEPFLGARGTRKMPDIESSSRAFDDLVKRIDKAKADEAAELRAEAGNEERQTLLGIARKKDSSGENAEKREQARRKLKELEDETEWGERYDGASVLVIPATDPDDGKTLRAFVLQILGFAAGIILARMFDVQLFSALLMEQSATFPVAMDYLITGLLIGGGSKPVHLLLRFVTQRKVIVGYESRPTEETEAEPMPSPATPMAPASTPATAGAEAHEWVDITYKGGVDRDNLESVHRRQHNPNIIVYHHTAMSSNSTFQDVVQVIKDRGWSTGYNCVIMPTGEIKPFCRWDRYGNHAAGHNRNSLGIAFHGNFETDPDVPFSNVDGRLGIRRPTEVQIKAGARVVALWTLLYNIDIDFDNTIVPHNAIAAKACPGGNFAYEEFEKWVAYFRECWEKSAYARQRIAAFKNKPYLYV